MELYQLLVNRVPAIRRRYHAIRQAKTGTAGRIYAWAALLGMNLSSVFFASKWERELFYPDEKKRLPGKGSESALSKREAPEELARRLLYYDVISFDVFDTLVFRPFSVPSDLFFRVGEKLGYLDFERIRREMEWRARQKAQRRRGSYEVTLEEIYQELEAQAGIPRDKGMEAETETELELCFGNPYMLEVFGRLQGHGKKIICVSDMYLPRDTIQRILEKCGYAGISSCFVSCELGMSKGDGKLFEKVRETYGEGRTYVHVGDHPESDIKMAAKCGFSTVFYQNVNLAGMPYRAEDLSAVTGSLYRGIVNAHIHNGLMAYSREYELGFVYGGLFVLGYCQFIHRYAQSHKTDKILFLSRDGEIINKVYALLYPEECGAGKTEYVYWSRLAAVKLSAGYYKYDYFRRFLEHKVNQNHTLEQIFKSMEIEDMLDQMCREFPDFAKNLGQDAPFLGKTKKKAHRNAISPGTELTDQNAWMVREYLAAHWEEVLSHYEGQLSAGKRYYERVLKGCKRVIAVDVGWAGSGAVALDYIVNHLWHLDCDVTGLLAGTNSFHNAEPNMSEPQLAGGKLASYLYSQGNNRENWKWHDAAKGHNLGVELLCGSAQGSLKGFYPSADAQGYHICLKEPDADGKMVEEIHKGILDFVGLVQLRMGNWRLPEVQGGDAYALLRLMLLQGECGGSCLEMGI